MEKVEDRNNRPRTAARWQQQKRSRRRPCQNVDLPSLYESSLEKKLGLSQNQKVNRVKLYLFCSILLCFPQLRGTQKQELPPRKNKSEKKKAIGRCGVNPVVRGGYNAGQRPADSCGAGGGEPTRGKEVKGSPP